MSYSTRIPENENYCELNHYSILIVRMVTTRGFVFEGRIGGIGPISMAIGPKGLERVEFGMVTKTPPSLSRRWVRLPFNNKIKKWLARYLKGKPQRFPYGLNIKGTEFQKKAWRAISKIPFGEVRSYKWIAIQIGRPKAVRAVGGACGANPIPLVIPCHRVVASNGLGGFGAGLNLKKKLLKLESNFASPFRHIIS